MFLLLLTAGCVQLHTESSEQIIGSPDGNISFLTYIEDGNPLYKITFKGQTLVDRSTLGITCLDSNMFRSGFDLVNAETTSSVDTFQTFGKRSLSISGFNELKLTLRDRNLAHVTLKVNTRVYNSGVAFRYILTTTDGKHDSVWVVNEPTTFNLADDPTCWYLQRANEDFEGPYSVSKLSAIPGDSAIMLPFTAQYESGVCISIMESDLNNYAGLRLVSSGSSGVLNSSLSKRSEDAYSVRSKLPLTTPWRIISIAERPEKLIESDLVMHLNPATPLDNLSWIRPGKAMWTWYANGTSMINAKAGFTGMNTASLKRYIDYSASLDCQYFLIDAGWAKGQEHDSLARNVHNVFEPVNGLDMESVVSYAAKKNIGVIVWTNYATIRNRVDSVFHQFQRWGLAGAKIDFISSDRQTEVDFVNTIVKKAAAYKLVLDLHSVYKPTGISRTYPNLLTTESVMGAEYNKWSKVTPEFNVTIPFTRNLSGPMDYTPAGFNEVFKNDFISQYSNPMTIGSRMHHLAMYIVYDSPLQMISDDPILIENEAGSDLLKIVPTYWDETIGLSGAIGEHIFIARRKGDTWFVGGMTDNPMSIDIPLNFLSGNYLAKEYIDDPTGKETLLTRTVKVNGKDLLKAKLLDSGGYIAILQPTDH